MMSAAKKKGCCRRLLCCCCCCARRQGQSRNMRTVRNNESRTEEIYSKEDLAFTEEQKDLKDRLNFHIKVVRAKGFSNKADHLLGSDVSDSFCICSVKNRPHCTFRTKVIKNSLDPEWDHDAELMDCQIGDILTFTVWDQDALTRHELLGTATTRLSTEIQSGELMLDGGGSIEVTIQPFNGPPLTQSVQRVFLISATNHVLEQRAEMRGLRAFIRPATHGKFIGGFVPAQFNRKGPLMDFWVESDSNPYPYPNYFHTALPKTDPLTVLSPSERKFLVQALIKDPMSEVRLPDGTKARRGAQIDPRELKLEGILEDHMPIGSIIVSDHLIKRWALPWLDVGWCRFLGRNIRLVVVGWCAFLRLMLTITCCSSRVATRLTGGLFRVNHYYAGIAAINTHFGPQVATYFHFIEYYVRQFIAPACLGGLAWFAGDPQYEAEHAIWKYCQPCFGLVLAVWGSFFCAGWRRNITRIAHAWQNGLLELGSEIESSSVSSVLSKEGGSVRPEFALAFRRRFERQSKSQQQETLASITHALRLDRSEVAEDELCVRAFDERTIRCEIEDSNVACYVPDVQRAWRNFLAVLVTFAFLTLAASTTAANLAVQEMIAGTSKATFSGDLPWEQQFSYIASGFIASATIPVLSMLHKSAAKKTTKWQNLRTDIDHDIWVFAKLFVFEFFNQTFPIFWIAFHRKDVNLLRTHLFIVFFVQGVWGNTQEICLPRIKLYFAKIRQLQAGEVRIWRTRSSNRVGFFYVGVEKGGVFGRALRQVGEQAARNDEFDKCTEVIELVVQFGIVTMFASVFPMGPIFALASSMVELRIDAYKLLRLQRIPEPRMTVGIGMSYHALAALAFISLVTNSALCFVTEYPLEGDGDKTITAIELLLPGLSTHDRVLAAVVLEHVLVGCMYFVFWWSPVTSEVREEQYRQTYFETREEYAIVKGEAEGVDSLRRRGASSTHRNRKSWAMAQADDVTLEALAKDGGDDRGDL